MERDRVISPSGTSLSRDPRRRYLYPSECLYLCLPSVDDDDDDDEWPLISPGRDQTNTRMFYKCWVDDGHATKAEEVISRTPDSLIGRPNICILMLIRCNNSYC